MGKKGYWYRNKNGLTYRYSVSSRRKDFVRYNIDVKLNDAFARSAGAKDLGDLMAYKNCTPFDRILEYFGSVPKYLPITIDGKQSVIEKDGQYTFVDEFDKEKYQ